MIEITEDLKNNLRNSGVGDRFIDQTILDYPVIKTWTQSSEGDQFFSFKKGLILHGGWEAVKIGTLIERWFIIKKTSGAVLYLSELCEQLKVWGGQDQEERDPRVGATSMFIKRFQEDNACPCDPDELDLVTKFLENRFIKHNHLDILQISDKSLHWYPNQFKDFLNDCFVWLEV